MRADTTVVEANVAYPTDSGLLAKGVAKMAASVRQIKGAGLAVGTTTRDRTRTVRSRARSITANLRRRTDQAKDEVRAINADLVKVAGRAVAEARAVVRNAGRTVRRSGARASGRTRAAVQQLQQTAERVARVRRADPSTSAGTTPDGATRLVSLHDPDARPIAKGRLGKPVEFGYKAQVVDNEDGVGLDHNVETGNPPDAPMLVPAVERIRHRTGKPPLAVTADRGYGEAAVEGTLESLGVRKGRVAQERQSQRCPPRMSNDAPSNAS